MNAVSNLRYAKKASNGLSKYNWDKDRFEDDERSTFSRPEVKAKKPEPRKETALSSK